MSHRDSTRSLLIVAFLAWSVAATAQQSIGYVQGAFAVPQTPQLTVTVAYTGMQTAGDLNVVVVGWNDAASQVVSVIDTRGNVYLPALATTVQPGIQSQRIYYASNIVGGATNSITVSFNTAVSYPDVRIAEYRGIDPVTPLAGGVGASGTGTSSSSGALTTTVTNALLVGANYVQSFTTGPGTGFASRIVTPDGSILEDRILTSSGSYTATAPISPSAGWIMQLVAFRGLAGGVADTQAPTAPPSATATAVSSSRIDVTWTAATDNVGVTAYRVERCQGAGCSAFIQIGTATTLSYSDTNLSASTSYTYRIRATDAAGNLSPYSPSTTTTTAAGGDTQAPTAPINPVASASGSQITVAWTASTDNVGVASYRVERCQLAGCTNFAEIGISTTTSYVDAGLAASTTYRYRVRATDAAGNFGAYSTIASATTTDTQAPTAPASLSATAVSGTRINLAWLAAGDNVKVTGYLIERCQGSGCTNFAQIATTTTAVSYGNTGLAVGTSYSYRVRATDAAGNLGPYSIIATATTLDTQAPTAPGSPTATVVSSSQITLAWLAATDNVGVTSYRVERCQGAGCTAFAQIASTSLINYSDAGLAPSTTYRYRVRATDAAGNLGPYSTTVTAATTAGPDTQSPTAPGSPAAVPVSTSQINVSWTAATDNVGVTGYRLERCQGAGCVSFAEIATPIATNYSDTGLALSMTYRYRVRATDAAGNVGPYSTAVTATTLAPPLMTITVPAEGASVIGSTVAINYVVSGDLTEVNHAHFQLDGGPVVMDLTLDGVYQLSAVAPGAHSLLGFLVRSDHTKIAGTDSIVNFSATADTQAPTAPASLTASAISSSQVNLAWTPATDDGVVVAYRVERCQGAGCAAFAEIAIASSTNYSDVGLSASTSYTYRLRAVDGSGNLSEYSPTATVTTLASAPPVPISFVQGAYAVPQAPQSVVTVAYTSAQTAGDLNVVAIGWNDGASQVVSVSDAKGNIYIPALATTVQTGIQSQQIYYASNIVAGTTNSVTVTFNTAVSYPDVRIAEYRGIDPLAPVEAAVGASGTGTTSSSGTLTTTVANALLVGANYVQTTSTGPGTGFTSRMITSPDGSIFEDRIPNAVGTYSATAPTAGAGWVMQLVAFRGLAGGAADTQAPTAPTSSSATAVSSNRIDVTWTAASDNVGVTGYRVERCQGLGCNNFTQIGTAAALTFIDTGLAASTSYTYRIRATDAAGNLSSYSPSTTAATADPTPSALQIFLPADGSTISGTVTFGATVTGGIVGMQFQIDNVNVGPVVNPESTLSVNTAQFANGSHAIKVYGWDSQENMFEATPVAVSFSNATPGNPTLLGLWSGPFQTSLVSINMSLMGNGRVMMYDRLDVGNPDPQVWNPFTSSFRSVPLSTWTNLFCSGQVVLPDGRLFVVGGHAADDVGIKSGRIFDPVTNLWSSTPDMSVGRWYPTLTVLSNGKVLVLSGEVGGMGDYAQIPEVYDPATNTWTQLPLAALSLPYYPHAFVLPNGQVAVTGTAELPVPARTLDVATQTWTTVDSRLFDAYSSAMYLPGKILKTGKSTNSLQTGPSVATAYVIDMTQATPRWRQVSSMAFPRAYHVETLLPDGSVLVTGGGKTVVDYDIANAVYAAELWSPATETWTTLSSMHAPRLYHGSALLLPDGRVLVSGGGRSPGPDPRDQQSIEIFAPPYLFKGARPKITAAPAQLLHNQVFTVVTPDAGRIASVALIAVGNMTHGINMSQRYVPLAFSTQAGQLTVTAPPDANVAPPGTYMLFVTDDQGVPSLASFTRF